MSKAYGLENHGIINPGQVHWNPTAPALYESVTRRGEGLIAQSGALAVRTGNHTGRSPDDKFIVREPSSEEHVAWGKVNRAIEAIRFDALYERLLDYLQGHEIFVQDRIAGADPKYCLPIRVITEYAWHSLFAHNLFIAPSTSQLEGPPAEFTVIDAPGFRAVPSLDDTNSEVCILIHFAQKLALIGGTSYAGEIKKSIFTILNYYLPLGNVFSMHCSANAGKSGDVALFFGLSGTGKTTLSADPERRLIGDDEHGWSDDGIFNLEGGCYAKVIRLSKDAEPQIYECVHRFGAVLENVVIDPQTRRIDLDDAQHTENTRSAYPLEFVSNAVIPSVAGHPNNVIMLTCDAFGVMPPISRLTPAQAMYHFLSGYTAKVAGTEKGLANEPSATFSTCFGAPFMVLNPTVYARMLGEKIEKHRVKCWLVNTGWTGGPFGAGHRMSIAYTRAIIHAALNGRLSGVPFSPDPVFGFEIPQACEGVPAEVLQPRNTWADTKAYDRAAKSLAVRFESNFRQFEGTVDKAILDAAPRRE